MKMTETLLIALLDIAKNSFGGGYPSNWKTGSRKKLVEMGLVEENVRIEGVWVPESSRSYRLSKVGEIIAEQNKTYKYAEGHYFVKRNDNMVFEFNINTIGHGMHVVELKSVDGYPADNYSDPFRTIKEAEADIYHSVPRYYRHSGLGWCVGLSEV